MNCQDVSFWNEFQGFQAFPVLFKYQYKHFCTRVFFIQKSKHGVGKYKTPHFGEEYDQNFWR